MKKALLLCVSHNDLGLIRALRKLGYYIVATGNREDLPGIKWVDKWLKEDYSDKDRILQIAKEECIDAICACCNDYGVYTAAFVAEKLRLPGYDSFETTLVLHNKDMFKKFAKENNITSPFAHSFEQKKVAHDAIRKMQLPVIIKPVDCSAGNGISVVRKRDDISKALETAFSASRAKRIVVEKYLTGTQHGFCTYLLNEKVVAYCTNNEYSIVNPFRVEIDTFPADNWEACKDELVEQIEKIAALLHLKDGIFHLQYIYADGKPWILEVMRRTVGNMYHVLGNQLNGIDWEYWEAKARCGLDCSDFLQPINQEGYYAYKALLANKNGVVENICIPSTWRKYIFKEQMLMSPGDKVTNYMSQPIGFLFMMFSSMEEMKDVLITNYTNDIVIISE